MKEKFLRGFKKVKVKFIVAMILWLLISLLFIAPLSVGIKETMKSGNFDITIFFEKMTQTMSNFFSSIGKSFTYEYIGTFWSCLWKVTVLYFIAMIIGLVKALPKGEYGDIEHGSGDWSDAGEQYSVLSNKKGLILAEKNYLPIDKRGNVNVLVVGRFRFW